MERREAEQLAEQPNGPTFCLIREDLHSAREEPRVSA